MTTKINKKSDDISNSSFMALIGFFIIALVIFILSVYYYGYFVKTTGYATYSGYVNLTISSSILLNITQDTVNWGSGMVNTSGGWNSSNLTTHGAGAATVTGGNWSTSAKALVVENYGNVNCSLKLSGTKTAHAFFGSQTSSNESYQWNISNKDPIACGEWNETAAKERWADVNTTTATICNKLFNGPGNRGMYIDFLLTVPWDANASIANGVMQVDTITITGDTAI